MSLSNINIVIGGDIKGFSTAMQNVQRQLTKVGEKMQETGKNMSLYISAPLAALGGFSLKAAGDMEKLENALKVAAKGQEDFNEQYQNLKDIAKLPGINLEEAIKSSIQLQAVGLNAREAEEAMRQFANAVTASGGGAENFAAVNKQLTQMLAKNRILQEDVGIITEHMPNMATLMQKAFGTANVEIIRANYSAKEFVNKLVEAGATLPRVQGGISNAFDNMKSSVTNALAKIGEAINKNFNVTGIFEKLSSVIDGLVDKFTKLSPAWQKVIIAVGAFVAIIGPLLVGIGFFVSTILPALITGLGVLTAVFSPLGITIMAVVAAVAALAAIAYVVYQSWDVIVAFFQGLWSEVKVIFADAILSIIKSVEKLSKHLGIEFTGAKQALEELSKESKIELGLTKQVSFEQVLDSMKNTVYETVDDIKSAFNFQVASTSNFGGGNKPAGGGGGPKVDGVSNADAFKSRVQGAKEADLEILNSAKNTQREIGFIYRHENGEIGHATAKLGKDMKTFYDDLARDVQTFAGRFQEIFGGVMSFTNQVIEAKSVALENSYKKEKELIETSGLTEEAKAAKMQQLDEQVAKKRAALQRKKAIADKLSAMVSAGVNTAVAVTQALASAPPPLGIALAATIGALGAAQIAAIAATPIPAFATGGAVFGPTLAMVGDNPNAGSDPEIIAPLSKLKNMIGEGGIGGTVEFIIRGSDLYGVLKKETSRLGRVA